MTSGQIQIRKARQNNLMGVDVDIPRNRLIAVTGVSGSGKSSLAFDTLFREGQRRFLETLSAYARQFLGNLEKPDVESVEGLSPAIAVDQKSIQRGARSTVGTLTEIVDHLRVLYARAGRPHCPNCNLPLRSQTPEEIVQSVLREHAGPGITDEAAAGAEGKSAKHAPAVMLLAPLIRDRKGSHRQLFDDLRKKGFVRARVDGVVQRIEDVPELARYVRHSIEVVIDRLEPKPDKLARLREAIEQALEVGKGDLIVAVDGQEDHVFSTARTCPGCGTDTPPLEPRLFSFNSPHGACPDCQGLGERLVATERAVVKDPTLSIRKGALAVTRASGGALLVPHVGFDFLDQIAVAHDFDLDTPWKDLPRAAQKVVLFGTGEERFEALNKWSGKRFSGSVKWQRRFAGVIPAIETAVKEGRNRKQVARFLAHQRCPTCDGSRLKAAANAVLLGSRTFADVTRTPIGELQAKLDALELTQREQRIARDLLVEIRRRIDFLLEVGLSYLTLDRGADSLSGGEAQRIRLAAQLGAGLQGVLYVLDEPSIGLHARDHGRLLGALKRLRDAGNTVCVVEHDESTLRAADWLIDVGPGAGRHGGRIVAQGPPSEIAKSDTPTGRLLRGEIALEMPSARRVGREEQLVIRGARGFNLKDVDVAFPLGTLTAVTGVSGSGKSTLVNRILDRAVRRHLGLEAPLPETHDSIEGLEHVDALVTIDAAPIGRTPRSNPATYIGVLDPIRDLFASMPEAKMRGYTKSRFSFNVAGGRCEACGGAGAKYVELQFLAPVTVPCEECGGHRFQAETLDVKYKEHSVADVLALTAEDALALFADHPKIARPLSIMVEVGLGYLTLGQPSTTISGGEAQRLKLTSELQKKPRGHTLYILDEPTTGLHMQDVARLVAALQKLVDLGHTVLVIEHNLDLVLAADHVIDLGPEGGELGGELIAEGTPEEVEQVKRSYTGVALKAFRSGRSIPETEPIGHEIVVPATHLRVVGARTHNLKSVDVSIPRDALTVVTGPSGSGKSSLALDTIYTEGRRRFVESLSTYARQFLGTKDRPPVERIDGLGPSVAVEARTSSGHPRSTVATTTEIHDHLRVLWSRDGTRRCPFHGEKLERSDASRVAKKIISDAAGASGWIVAPIFGGVHAIPEDAASEVSMRMSAWRAAGFVRALVDGVEVRLPDADAAVESLVPTATFDLVIDRSKLDASTRARIAEAVEQAEAVSGGMVGVVVRGAGEAARHLYSTRGACPKCGFHIDGELEPRHFSFNTHVGACPECDGLGEKVTCDAALLVTHPDKSIEDGALHGKLGRYLSKGKGYYEMLLRTVARQHKIPLTTAWQDYTDEQRALLAYGTGAKKSYKVEIERSTAHAEIEETFVAAWPGLCGHVDAWHAKTEDPEWSAILETTMTRRTCAACQGERLRADVRAVTIGKLRLPELLHRSVADALTWISELQAGGRFGTGVEAVVAEIRSRLGLLDRVGLGYLTLDRHTSTLSGGEARRVRLSASLGSQLVGVCYVLDEPTVGLHPADVAKLTDALLDLRERGNTVIVVEHDASLMARADWIVDMGPGAGIHGGNVVVSGTPADVRKHATSLTGAAMRGDIALVRDASQPARDPRDTIKIVGARTHNLKNVDFEFAFGEITGVCGPSGSGKSTLVLDTLVPALEGEASEGRWKRLHGVPGGSLRSVVVDASPIGRTPASIPATYTGLMEPLRELYARSPDAQIRGFDAGRFSFNSPRGRCPACEGRGATKVEMQFLADLWLPCEECDGKRYAPEVLEVRWRGKNIAEALELTVEEAREFFAHSGQRISVVLDTLRDVGLSYLQLGQSSTTLSGGEAQRLKLASELFRAQDSARSVIVLDEPSTGLSTSDVVHLVHVFDRLAQRGNAVVLIEHHAGLLATCDVLVELGPTGGEAGGRIVAIGTPRDLAKNPASITGPFLFADESERAAPSAVTSSSASKRASRKKVVG